jgi:hypothetical protein
MALIHNASVNWVWGWASLHLILVWVRPTRARAASPSAQTGGELGADFPYLGAPYCKDSKQLQRFRLFLQSTVKYSMLYSVLISETPLNHCGLRVEKLYSVQTISGVLCRNESFGSFNFRSFSDPSPLFGYSLGSCMNSGTQF